jgi:hypothetical protein
VATVHLPSGLTAFTGGVADVQIAASHCADLMSGLARRFPELAGHLDEIAVAIDGEIYQHPGYQALRPDSEVHLVPRVAGGQSGAHAL